MPKIWLACDCNRHTDDDNEDDAVADADDDDDVAAMWARECVKVNGGKEIRVCYRVC